MPIDYEVTKCEHGYQGPQLTKEKLREALIAEVDDFLKDYDGAQGAEFDLESELENFAAHLEESSINLVDAIVAKESDEDTLSDEDGAAEDDSFCEPL